MKKSKFSDSQIMEALKRVEGGLSVPELCRDTYLRLALKAQAQCRATLETLAEVKYPKAPTFVRQQNMAYQQQVNNGEPANGNNRINTRTQAQGKSGNQSNELLEAQHGERLDSRAAGTAGGDDSSLEAMGAVSGAADTRRKAVQ